MGKFNQQTIAAYNHDSELYITNTPPTHQEYHKNMLKWIDTALEGLPKESRVFEIGSATPRDASYIRSKGYFVQTSDASVKLVDYLKSKGESSIVFDALTDNFPEGYDLFFANAVVPHFTPEDVTDFLRKLESVLSKGGRVAFNIKTGTGDSWINEKLEQKRFTHYWQLKDIEALIEKFHFTKLLVQTGAPGDFPTHSWINLVLQKS